MFNRVQSFLDGKKSYLISAVIFVLGGLSALGVHIPAEVYTMLGGLLGISLRSAIAK